MSECMSRRDALKKVMLLLGTAGALRGAAQAEQAAHLSPTDGVAMSLGYHDDAKTVDTKQFSTYQSGQVCSNCLQLLGTAGAPWRPCSIFPGKLVNANGWCRVWVKKG